MDGGGGMGTDKAKHWLGKYFQYHCCCEIQVDDVDIHSRNLPPTMPPTTYIPLLCPIYWTDGSGGKKIESKVRRWLWTQCFSK